MLYFVSSVYLQQIGTLRLIHAPRKRLSSKPKCVDCNFKTLLIQRDHSEILSKRGVMFSYRITIVVSTT